VTREYLNNTADGMHTNVAELMWHLIFIHRYGKKDYFLIQIMPRFLKYTVILIPGAKQTLYYH